MDKDSLLLNIIFNSGSFKHKEKLLHYHRKSASLESSINRRKLIEYNTRKKQYNLLQAEIDKYDIQKKNYIDKENKILEFIEKNKSNSSPSPNKYLLENIKEKKKEYQEYLNIKSKQIQNEFNLCLEQSLMVKAKKKELELLKMNEEKKRFIEQMMKNKEKLADEINELKSKNEELIAQTEDLEKQHLEQLKRYTSEMEKEKRKKQEILERQKKMRMNILDYEDKINKLSENKQSMNSNDENIINDNKNINTNNNEKELTKIMNISKEKEKEENEEKEDEKEEEEEKEEEKEEEIKVEKNEEEIKIEEEKKEKEKNIRINQTLEDMCCLGMIMKKEIEEEKVKNPEKFIEIKEALKKEDDDPGLFALGLLAQNLEDSGVETAIDSSMGEENDDESATTLQFLVNGMSNKTRYDLHFDFGEERNSEILNDENEYEKFKDDLKSKLSKDYNIPKEKIIVTYLQEGSVRVQVIFQSDEFNNLDKKEFLNKFKNESAEDFKELKYLKDIHTDVIMSACKLNRNHLDRRGNNKDGGWAHEGEKRGNKPYYPPYGWIGIGLKVEDKYDNNTWIQMNNSEGEWCVAYHGVGNNNISNEVKKITGMIYKTKYIPGINQIHEQCVDIFHPGNIVGAGVYCTPKIESAEGYAGISEINGIKYKTVLMNRVKPDAIRQCECTKDGGEYWVVDGTTDQIRPYRILYKRVDS